MSTDSTLSPRIGGLSTRSRVSSAYPEVDRVLLPVAVAVIGDVTSSALKAALDGLAQRQRVTADNIANVNTPRFLAGRVDFESSLRGALAGGGNPASAVAMVARSLEPTNTHGNNVNLDTETLSNIDTVLRYQFASRAVEGTFSSVRSALKTS